MGMTQDAYIDQIATAARSNVSSDWDVSYYAQDAFEAVRKMLDEHVAVIPKDATDEEKAAVRILIDDYIGFYLISHTELGGSAVDYCTYRIMDAFEGYAIDSIYDPQGMLEEISAGMTCALYPDRIYEELASIGIS